MFTSDKNDSLAVIDIDKSKDSTFVRRCLEIIYKDNLSVLLEKNLYGGTGSKKTASGNTPQTSNETLTPKNVKLIRQIFLARMSRPISQK